jgi:hypothetical protein
VAVGGLHFGARQPLLSHEVHSLVLSCQLIVEVCLLELSTSKTPFLCIPNLGSLHLVVFVDVFDQQLRTRIHEGELRKH